MLSVCVLGDALGSLAACGVGFPALHLNAGLGVRTGVALARSCPQPRGAVGPVGGRASFVCWVHSLRVLRFQVTVHCESYFVVFFLNLCRCF